MYHNTLMQRIDDNKSIAYEKPKGQSGCYDGSWRNDVFFKRAFEDHFQSPIPCLRSLYFRDDSSIAQDACNLLFFSYQVRGDTIHIRSITGSSPLRATK